MHAKLRKMIEVEAKTDAALFVEEFGVVLDPAKTDWDAEAWNMSPAAGLSEAVEMSSDAWGLYQSILVAETRRLVADKVSP